MTFPSRFKVLILVLGGYLLSPGLPSPPVATGGLVLLSPCRAAENVIDSPMYKLPDLPKAHVVYVFSDRAKSLWLSALERPEADLRCRAAQTIALAHRRGMKGLDTTIGPLRAVIDKPDEQAAVRLAAAQALIALDARQAAPSLFRMAQSGSNEMRELIEPVLARWDHEPARAMWLERLNDPAASGRGLILAIEALGTVHEKRAGQGLSERVLSNRTAVPVRLEAARALGRLRTGGLEKDAASLAGDTSMRGLSARLAAALLLQQHRSKEAGAILQRLVKDREPAVAALAVAPLVEMDAKLVGDRPTLDHLLGSADAKLRSFGVEILFRLPTDENIRLLANRLDDEHPEVREKARRSLYELAVKQGLRTKVIAEGMRMLATGKWQALEQSTILLTYLDHKPAARRLVELLPAGRSEVFITAAWGLRKLAVAETLPDVLRYAGAEQKRLQPGRNLVRENKEVSAILIDHQLSQLNQLMGQQKYAPADAVLRRFVPRMGNVVYESRAAGMWALGILHEGKPDTGVAKAAIERLTDTSSLPPEDVRVRSMSSITLGRMGAKDALDTLKRYAPATEYTDDPVNNASLWAIVRLTGKAAPVPMTVHKTPMDWFLSPR